MSTNPKPSPCPNPSHGKPAWKALKPLQKEVENIFSDCRQKCKCLQRCKPMDRMFHGALQQYTDGGKLTRVDTWHTARGWMVWREDSRTRREMYDICLRWQAIAQCYYRDTGGYGGRAGDTGARCCAIGFTTLVMYTSGLMRWMQSLGAGDACIQTWDPWADDIAF